MNDNKIIFRALDETDLENLFHLTSNDNIAKYMRFDTHQSIDETKELLNQYIKFPSFAIEIDYQFAGIFVFKQGKPFEYSLTTFLDEPYWNKGYSTYILNTMKDYAFNKLHAKSLNAYVVSENKGSRKVLMKNGFVESEFLKFPDLPCELIIYQYVF